MSITGLANALAGFVTGTVTAQLGDMKAIVRRDPAATEIGLIGVFAWVARSGLHQHFPEEIAEQITFAMLERLADHVGIVGRLDDVSARRFLKNRLAAYDAWWAYQDDSDADPPWNIAKFLYASCQEVRVDLEWNQIMPNPDEISHVDGANPDFIEQLRSAAVSFRQRTGRAPCTYTLNASVIAEIMTAICEFMEAVRARMAQLEE